MSSSQKMSTKVSMKSLFCLKKKTFAPASRRRHLIFDVHFLQFTATGLMIIARNYLEVYPYDKWSDKVIQFPFSRI